MRKGKKIVKMVCTGLGIWKGGIYVSMNNTENGILSFNFPLEFGTNVNSTRAVNSGLAVTDFNADGVQDLVMGFEYSDAILLMKNAKFPSLPDFGYTFVGDISYGSGSHTPVIGNLDGDQQIEILADRYIYTLQATGYNKGYTTNAVVATVADLNGDGKIETASAGPIRQFYRGRNKDGVGWMIRFEDSTVSELPLGCCLTYMINEGDLNKNGTDELSIYAKPADENDCNYYFSTYTFTKTGWKKIIDPFVIANGCMGMDKQVMLSRVTLENGNVYYSMDTLGKTVKRKAF